MTSAALSAGKNGGSLIQVRTHEIEQIQAYAYCPALYVLRELEKVEDPKHEERKWLTAGIHELVIRSLDQSNIQKQIVEAVLKSMFSKRLVGKSYNRAEVEDITKKAALLVANLINQIAEKYTITGGPIPVSVAYMGAIVNGETDLFLRDEERGYIHPVVVDLSGAKSEPYYNLISYRCQLINDHFNLEGKAVQTLILSPATGKSWIHDNVSLSSSLRISIGEIVSAMAEERYPLRLGWWCGGCSMRSVCFRKMADRSKR